MLHSLYLLNWYISEFIKETSRKLPKFSLHLSNIICSIIFCPFIPQSTTNHFLNTFPVSGTVLDTADRVWKQNPYLSEPSLWWGRLTCSQRIIKHHRKGYSKGSYKVLWEHRGERIISDYGTSKKVVEGEFSNKVMVKFRLKEFTEFLPADKSKRGIPQCLKGQSVKGAVHHGRRSRKIRQRIS